MRISFGSCLFDSDRRSLERHGRQVHLSPRAFAVLELLVAERPRAVSKQTLLDRVWSDAVVEEQNVKNAIVEIRAALGEDASAVHTVQRFGYAFDTPGLTGGTSARLVSLQRTWSLSLGENAIGRDPACAIAIQATGVSRHHARILIRDAAATLEDLGSKNGTWHNEKRIESAVELRDGDTIRVGITSLTFRDGGPAPPTTTVA